MLNRDEWGEGIVSRRKEQGYSRLNRGNRKRSRKGGIVQKEKREK